MKMAGSALVSGIVELIGDDTGKGQCGVLS